MTATLRRYLVLEQDAGRPGLLEITHGADDVVQIAVAGVAVGDERDSDAVRDPTNRFRHLRQRDEADIGVTERAGRDAEAAEEEHLHAGLFRDAGGEDVMDADGPDEAGPGEKVTEEAGGGHACLHIAPGLPGDVGKVAAY